MKISSNEHLNFFSSHRRILKGCIILSLFFSGISSFSQEKLVGLIVDSEDNPIPYAHVVIQNTSTGTIANQAGQFRLSVNSNEQLSFKITCIGYKPQIIHNSQELKRIVLEEDVSILSQVTVTPRDYAREIVEKAIERIPFNYPNNEEMHRGFAREHVYWDSIGSDPIYVAESMLDSRKRSYSKPIKNGEVELIEGRKYEGVKLDSLPIRFYGGSHDAHSLDVVASRRAFLNKPAKYVFEIADTTRFDSQDVFKINFFKKDHVKGSILIMDSSFAILRAEFYYWNFKGLLEDRFRRSREYSKFSVEYDHRNGIWRLKNIVYETAFDFQRRKLYLLAEYVTTDIEKSTRGIPYLNQIQYGDIYLESTGEYDSTFWNNYNIIVPNARVDSLFKSRSYSSPTSKDQDLSRMKRIYQVLKKFRTAFGVQLTQLTLNEKNISFSNDQFEINESNELDKLNSVSLISTTQYEWKKSVYIGLSSAIVLTKASNSVIDIHLSKEINLSSNGRPIFVSPGIAFGYQQISRKIGNFKSESNFEINDKKFDSGSTDISVRQRGFRIFPSLTFGIEKSHRIQYHISAGYNFPINQKIGLFFDETDQFFLKQKSAFLENGKEGLVIESKENLFETNWTFSAGVYFSF